LNPREFEYHSPTSLKETVATLEKYKGEAKILAGGQSLIPLMKLRLVAPAHVVDIGRVRGLSYIRRESGFISIGAMTRMSEIESSELIAASLPILRDCASEIADPLVRNMGTIGGNVSHADPTNDMPAVMVATRSQFEAVGPKGRRSLSATTFFKDTFTTELLEEEVLSEIRIPTARYKDGAYVKLERQAGDFGIAGVAASLTLGKDGQCKECGIALTGVGPTVIRALRSEEKITGGRVGASSVESAAELAAEDSQPVADLRGTVEYKREMVGVLTKRALSLALKRTRARLR